MDLEVSQLLCVVLYHAQIEIFNLEPFKGGFIGVDIFCNIWVFNNFYYF